jgi:hypothetical protein
MTVVIAGKSARQSICQQGSGAPIRNIRGIDAIGDPSPSSTPSLIPTIS